MVENTKMESRRGAAYFLLSSEKEMVFTKMLIRSL